MKNVNQFSALRWRTGIPLLNWFGSRFRDIQYLDADALMANACEQSGLSDWGAPDIKVPLQKLVDSYEGNRQLTPVGRFFLRGILTRTLIKRLTIVNMIKLDQSISARTLANPVFIIGMPRSGTTLLYNLLAMDSRFRALKTWETYNPVSGRPPKPAHQAIARSIMKFIMPMREIIHPRSPLNIEESTWLLANSLYTPGFYSLYGDVRDYEHWLMEQSDDIIESAYQFYKSQLQILQDESDGRRWLLKSPAHAPHLETLLRVFPDARVIMPVRDMKKTLPSMLSLFTTVRTLFCEQTDNPDEWRDTLRMTSVLQNRLPQTISKLGESVLLVDFDALVENKGRVLEDIYRWLTLAPEVDFRQRLDEFQRIDTHVEGGHKYSLEQFGLEESDIPEQFGTQIFSHMSASVAGESTR